MKRFLTIATAAALALTATAAAADFDPAWRGDPVGGLFATMATSFDPETPESAFTDVECSSLTFGRAVFDGSMFVENVDDGGNATIHTCLVGFDDEVYFTVYDTPQADGSAFVATVPGTGWQEDGAAVGGTYVMPLNADGDLMVTGVLEVIHEDPNLVDMDIVFAGDRVGDFIFGAGSFDYDEPTAMLTAAGVDAGDISSAFFVTLENGHTVTEIDGRAVTKEEAEGVSYSATIGLTTSAWVSDFFEVDKYGKQAGFGVNTVRDVDGDEDGEAVVIWMTYQPDGLPTVTGYFEPSAAE